MIIERTQLILEILWSKKKEKVMEQWIEMIMEQYGYIGIFALILLENVFPPIPSEIILTFGGFMTTQTSISVVGVIGFATIGSTLGAVILYGFGRMMNEERLIQFVNRYPVFRVKQEHIEKTMNWYRKYEYKTVFFCRMIPIVRSLISIPAGIGKMALLPFVLLTALGSLLWNTVLVVAGAMLGEAWRDILVYMDLYSNIVIGAVVVAVGGYIVYLYTRRKKEK